MVTNVYFKTKRKGECERQNTMKTMLSQERLTLNTTDSLKTRTTVPQTFIDLGDKER